MYSAELLKELKKGVGKQTPDVEYFRKMQPKQGLNEGVVE